MPDIRYFLLLLLLFCGLHWGADAQQKRPKALLIQLSTEQNRHRFLSSTHQTAKLEQLLIDVAAINSRLIEDFNDNFRFCPVYYYYDTSWSRIAAGEYNSVLLDSNLEKIGARLDLTKEDYVWIGYYGLGTYQLDPNKDYSKDKRSVSVNYPEFFFMGTNFEVLPEPMPVRANTNGFNRLLVRFENSKYRYVSPKFSLRYKSAAKYAQSTMTKFFEGKKK